MTKTIRVTGLILCGALLAAPVYADEIDCNGNI